MDFPTDEELFELQYQDEMDAMNDMETENLGIHDENMGPSSHVNQTKSKFHKTETAVEGCSEMNQSSSSKAETSFASPNDEISCTVDESKELFIDIEEKELDQDNNTSKEHSFELTQQTKLPTKRKLLYPPKDQITIDVTSSVHEDEQIFEFSENLSLHKEKRKVSSLSDDEIECQRSAKKLCSESTTETIEQDKYQSQTHSSFISSFSKEKIPFTCPDGRRVYFFVNDEDDKNSEVKSFSQKTSSLLPTPIQTLKDQYFMMEYQMLEENDDVPCSTSRPSEPELSVVYEEKDIETLLWVEKYRPLSYTHLLSEEGLNRTLLQWLKLWDKVVFDKEKKMKRKSSDATKLTKSTKFQKSWGELIEEKPDEHGRPYHKVAFLCGPPGLGKTTLATVIAKHAGYNVVELNASDDRNPEAFRTSLEAATQMKSVLHGDHRPNCLILDEIDGAPAASINVLISFIKSTGIPKGKQRKKGDIPLLMRPVICICNDQYASALKPLRQLALLLNFPCSAVYRLAGRLYEVCVKEGLLADMAALAFLCEKAANDVRSCLSTLQFIRCKQRELKVSDLKNLTLGQKDMQKGLFTVWQDVFYFREKKSFSGIFNTIQAFGDYDKVYIGLFENYLNIKFKHSSLDVISEGSEWMCFSDIVQQQIAQRQLYFLLPYLPYPAVAFHMLFASTAFPRITYPTPFYEHKTKSSQLSSTLTSIIKDIISSLKTFLNPTILLTDMFPFLLEILKPNLRPVNTQLYSEREKKELRRVIELMLAFNLNYRQERLLDGTYNYILDPNIEELIAFSDLKSRKVLTYSTKQMIAREVEMEQMRKGDSPAEKGDFQKGHTSVRKDATDLSEQKPLKKKDSLVDKPVLDFFGRPIVPKTKASTENKKDCKEEEIWFRFKEGYSNAVKKTIYIKDLL